MGAVPADIAAQIRTDYHATLDAAFKLLPPGTPPRRRQHHPHSGWNHARRKAFNLATRLRQSDTDVLRLLDDTRIPFTNNDAERSLRMVKISVYRLSADRPARMKPQARAGKLLLTEVRRTEPSGEGRLIHDKISGTFQSADGAARFVTVRSYLQTADAHGHNLLDACRQLFTTGAWQPPPAASIP